MIQLAMQSKYLMQHIVASHEATDTLHRAMCLAPYLPGGMVVAIAVNFVTFYYIVVVELN